MSNKGDRIGINQYHCILLRVKLNSAMLLVLILTWTNSKSIKIYRISTYRKWEWD